jgi:hypothetical protein
MLIRATIVLLAVLNLGVAAWWLWRPAPVAPAFEQPAGVPRLVMLEDIIPAQDAAPVPATRAKVRAVPPPRPAAVPGQPVRPEAEAVSNPEPRAAAAAPAVPAQPPAPTPASLADQPRCEGAGEGAARGWRVYLPPAPDLATADATARRIAEAGFTDYLVLRDGESANAISLGLYSTEASAQRRSAALRAGGFPARCARIPATTPA